MLLVIDSVICAFGRVGTWFGYERWDIEPDMVVLAKGITSGYLPLGGVLISDEVAEPFWAEPGGPMFRHGATYAGHPTCCAAALANLDILERESLIPRGRELEGELMDVLAPLADHAACGEIRGGLGLAAAVDLTPEALTSVPGAMARYCGRDSRGGRAAARSGDGRRDRPAADDRRARIWTRSPARCAPGSTPSPRRRALVYRQGSVTSPAGACHGRNARPRCPAASSSR